MEIEIKIPSQTIIPEIKTAPPKNVKLRVYDAKTWNEYTEISPVSTI